MSTVEEKDGHKLGSFSVSRGMHDAWKKCSETVDLGEESQYLGGTLYLQQLATSDSLSDAGEQVPFVYSKLSSSGDRIEVSWDLLAYSR